MLAALMLLVLLSGSARAIDDIPTEEIVRDLLVTPRTVEETVPPPLGRGTTGGVREARQRRARSEVHDRDFLDRNLTLDVHAANSFNAQSRFAFALGHPYVDDGCFLWSLRAGYEHDPQYRFFALGTNDLGPHPVTAHRRRRVLAQALFGRRPWSCLALNATAAVRFTRFVLDAGYVHRLEAAVTSSGRASMPGSWPVRVRRCRFGNSRPPAATIRSVATSPSGSSRIPGWCSTPSTASDFSLSISSTSG
jgi:hypothetical protein